MKRFPIVVTVVLFTVFPAASRSQSAENDTSASTWDNNIRVRVYFNQIYQENWTKGGDEVFNWEIDSDNEFTRDSEKTTFDNIVKIRFAQNRISGEENRITKNELSFRSAFIFKRTRMVNPFFGATAKTQITTGYAYFSNKPREARSDFWDPATLTQSFGIDISMIEHTKMRLSFDYRQEIADRYTHLYDIDDPVTAGVEKVKVSKGMTFWSRYQQNFGEKFAVKVEVESIYGFMHYSNIIVDADMYLDFKLVSFINLSIQPQYRYDKSQSKQGQFKSSMGITLVFDLFK